MNPLLHDLPYDPTGELRTNRTKREFHDVSDQEGLPFRVFALDKGYFYTHDLYIEDNRGYELIPDVDYQCTNIHPDITTNTGLTGCALIVIKNPRVGHELYVDAQMVGGPYRSRGYSIVELARNLLNNTRKVHWVNIEKKPDGYRPNGHLHGLWDLYHFTPRTAQLKRMTAAIQVKGAKALDGVYGDYTRALAALEQNLTGIEGRLIAHIADHEDPHDVTKQLIGLGLLGNYGKATEIQARQPNDSIRTAYATPWSAKLSIDSNFTPVFANHTNNQFNPHRTSAEQLLGWSIPTQNDVMVQYADRGATLDVSHRFMTYEGIHTWNEFRQGNYATNLTSGVLQSVRYSPAAADANWILSAAGTWLNIAAVFASPDAPKPVAVYYAQAAKTTDINAAKSIISAIYGNATQYPVGTMVIFNTPMQYGNGTGNGGWTTDFPGQFMLRRFYANGDANDWQYNAEPPRT